MYFAEENRVIPQGDVQDSQKHMICQNPSCPTVVEPFSNRLICQCYNRSVVPQDHQQVQVTSMQQTSDLKVEPALYNSAYLRVNSPERKGARAPQVRQESSLESLAMLSSGFTPGVATTKPAPNFDTLMKPQVHDYMNMQKSYDINNPGKKVDTRHATGVLKAWLREHRKSPYPSKQEKIMFTQITKMTMTQVCTWFANARRRMKKENSEEGGSSDNNSDSAGSGDEDDDGDGEDSRTDTSSQDSRKSIPITPIGTLSTNAKDSRLPGFDTFMSSMKKQMSNPQPPVYNSPPMPVVSHHYGNEHGMNGGMNNQFNQENYYVPYNSYCDTDANLYQQSYYEPQFNTQHSGFTMYDNPDDKGTSGYQQSYGNFESHTTTDPTSGKTKIWSISELIGSAMNINNQIEIE